MSTQEAAQEPDRAYAWLKTSPLWVARSVGRCKKSCYAANATRLE